MTPPDNPELARFTIASLDTGTLQEFAMTS
jgi:hypothetical protein